MNKDAFDFGSMLDEQLKGIRRGYKFGKAFNEDKSIVRPERKPVEVMSDDNASVKAAYERGEALSGIVEKEIKGGYEVTLAGERTFCPYSQIDKVRRDPSEFIGRKFDFLVSEYSKDERGLSIVVSRRALIEREQAALREEAFARLEEGQTLNGTVTNVLSFGAFVDLGGVEGLIPVREIAWDRTDDPTAVLKAGDGVTVKVLRVDHEAEKVTLSRKECLPRVFKRSPEEIEAARNAEEVAAWMRENEGRNASVGSLASAFDGLKL